MSTELNEHLKRIMELPRLIAEASENCNRKDEIESRRNNIKDFMADHKMKAGTEVDDGGKKKYTNDEQRTRRANEIAKTDPEYQEEVALLGYAETEKFNAEIRREQLKNELSALKAVIFAMTEQLKTENIITAAKNNKMRMEVCCVAQ